MISKIEVDGFRSLSNFNLELLKGVNILVGPNGAGKTNIVLFFEFLSYISTQPLSNAVSALGGAGSVFRKKGQTDYQNRIAFQIIGTVEADEDQRQFSYEYGAEIGISFEKDDVFYSKQILKICFDSEGQEHTKSLFTDIHEYDLHVEMSGLGEAAKVKVHSVDPVLLKGMFYFHDSDSDDTIGSEELEKILPQRRSHSLSLVVNVCGHFEELSKMRRDFVGGESLNIIPSKVKEQEDAASAPGIRKDGSGLASTLYSMKKGRPRRAFRPAYFYPYRDNQYEAGMLQKILSYLQLANRTITDLDISNDQFDNRLVVKIHVGGSGQDAVLPLSAMSDGTLKWLTLIAAIMTSETIFSIEEPENYLHPWMQAEIINIMRDRIDEKKYDSFVLITTHSESLLNHAKAKELVVVDFENGSTQANRVSNIQEIESEISNSGFGLGNFYFSDALSHD